jgi:hypothetical protein
MARRRNYRYRVGRGRLIYGEDRTSNLPNRIRRSIAFSGYKSPPIVPFIGPHEDPTRSLPASMLEGIRMSSASPSFIGPHEDPMRSLPASMLEGIRYADKKPPSATELAHTSSIYGYKDHVHYFNQATGKWDMKPVAGKGMIKRGRGFASDFMENIPIIGPFFANWGRKVLGIGLRRGHYRYVRKKFGGRLRRVHVRAHRIHRYY